MSTKKQEIHESSHIHEHEHEHEHGHPHTHEHEPVSYTHLTLPTT